MLKTFAQYVADGMPHRYLQLHFPTNTSLPFAAGKVKPVVDSIFAFDDALKAYDRIMTKHACGKVVVKVDSEAY